MVIVPARRAGDPGSIPGPGQNFFSLIIKIFEYFICYGRTNIHVPRRTMPICEFFTVRNF